MQRITHVCAILIAGLCVVPLLAASPQPAVPRPDPRATAFFESKIRPLLTEKCYACHGIDTPRGGLDLRSREAIIKGGDTGAGLVPGDPAQSLLIEAVRYEGATKMPPAGRLSDDEIRNLTEWVRLGVPWGADTRAPVAKDAGRASSQKTVSSHWSFQPVRHLAPPALAGNVAAAPIDRFLLADLQKHGLRPNPWADRRTLIRRVYFDLIGLPPTPEQIAAFLSDRGPNALGRLVDRLLSSPRFGERWGRHWLDVARYADSNGLDENIVFESAWRYRDYVIKSFNRDKPFDLFIVEQIAGDLVWGTPRLRSGPSAEKRGNPSTSLGASGGESGNGLDGEANYDPLIASGFLVLGPKILAERDKDKLVMDVIDEQIDVVSKAFLGLTASCARCHDHKFDPIPTRDYYALAGIFRSTTTLFGNKLNNVVVSGWMERPLAPAEVVARNQAHQEQVAKLQVALKAIGETTSLASTKGIAPQRLSGIVVDDEQAEVVGDWKRSSFSPPFVGEHYLHDDNNGKGSKSVRFIPDLPRSGRYVVRLVYATGTNRARRVPVTVSTPEETRTVYVDQRAEPSLQNVLHPLGVFALPAGKSASVTISNAGTDGHVIADAVQFVPEEEVKTEVLSGQLTAEAQRKKEALEGDLKKLQAAAPPALPMAMAVQDGEVRTCRICIRGNHENLGEEVPRGFLTAASFSQGRSLQGEISGEKGSGRLELARWIAHADNPLTARVFVNRVWHHLFGRGLVATPDNFGAQGEAPTHPELLDYLARRFVAQGWSVKQLIREIVLSRAYQMSSAHQESAYAKDPENRLLWRMNRKRLDGEAIRDAMLVAGGRLDDSMGGTILTVTSGAVINNQSKGTGQIESNRRSVYLPVIRSDAPELLQLFDFVDPHVSTGKREVTTVAPQALYLLNSPFVIAQSRRLARVIREAPGLDDETRITMAYERTVGRIPSRAEIAKAAEYLSHYGVSEQAGKAWQRFCQALLASAEFRVVE